MKKLAIFVLACISIIFPISCSARFNSAVSSVSSTPSLLPTANLMKTPSPAIPTLITVPLPTVTIKPTQVVLTPTQKPTDTLPIAKDFSFEKKCASIEGGNPPDMAGIGNLVELDISSGRTVIDDFQGGAKKLAPFPPVNEYAVSPDGKWLAYINTQNNGKGTVSRALKITDLNGHSLDMYFWQINWQWILGWIDNRHLALYITRYPEGQIVLLDPFAATWRVVDPVFSDYVDNPAFLHINYNPKFSDVLYLNNDKNNPRWVLFNIPLKQVMWQGKYDTYDRFVTLEKDEHNYPRWSPDGQRLAMYEDSKLIVLNRDGTTIQLTGSIKGLADRDNNFSWSPDSQSLVAWIIDIQEGHCPCDYYFYSKRKLVLFDLQKKAAFDLCIEQDHMYYSFPPPQWSFNGRYLVAGYPVREGNEYSYKETWVTDMIDLQSNKGYHLPGSLLPLAWMIR